MFADYHVHTEFSDDSVYPLLDVVRDAVKMGMEEICLTDILRQVISDGKGIELNTSYHRYGLHDSTPARAILELYRDLGGRVLTVGSDSHKPEHLGTYIQEGKALLRELGFRELCTFEKMEPSFHPL